MSVELTFRRLLNIHKYLKINTPSKGEFIVEHTDESLQLCKNYAACDPAFALLMDFPNRIPNFILVGRKAVEIWYQTLTMDGSKQALLETIADIRRKSVNVEILNSNWRFDGAI